ASANTGPITGVNRITRRRGGGARARQINEADVFLSSLRRRGALPPKAETRSAAALHSRICRTRGCREVPGAVLHSTVKARRSLAFVPYEITENPRPGSALTARPSKSITFVLPLNPRTRERRRCLR
ncbi:hypothetical protein DBV15_06096, partial [Temnothorax longispinosus]